MPLANLTAELMGTFPRFPYLHAAGIINRAWSRVRDMRMWSWQLIVDSQLYAPTIITAGAVSTTLFSTSVTVNSTAATALNAAATYPPVASPTLGLGRQIRIGAGSNLIPNNWSIYNIVAWDGVNTITLDKPFAEGTLTNSPYQVFRCYYAPPAKPPTSLSTTDGNLIRALSLTNRNSGYSIRGKRLYASQETLNQTDPTRGSQGDAHRVAPYQETSTGSYVFEFWPCPVLQTVYGLTYYSRWPDVSATQDFPVVPYGLVHSTMDLARALACQWALANAATYPELQQTNWVAAGEAYRRDWIDSIKLAIKQDDEIMPQLPFFQGRRTDDWPLSGSFLQNHDVSGF